MKTELIYPDKLKKKKLLLTPILTLLLGIILITKSNTVITSILILIGLLIVVFGVYQFFRYIQLKKQFNMVQSNILMTATMCIMSGLLLVLLANVLEIGLRIIIGLGLISYSFVNVRIFLLSGDNKYLFLTKAILFLILGLYTIFIQNIAFVFIGVILIINSMFDLFRYFKENEK